MENKKLLIDTLLDINDMQRIFKAGRATIFQFVKDGIIPAPIKIGGLTRWRSAQVIEFIDKL